MPLPPTLIQQTTARPPMSPIPAATSVTNNSVNASSPLAGPVRPLRRKGNGPSPEGARAAGGDDDAKGS
jgi:hypothetical protein